jgi:hypothetical protein
MERYIYPQVRWHGDGVCPKVGGGVRWGVKDENAEGGDTGGVRGVIKIFFSINSINNFKEYKERKTKL